MQQCEAVRLEAGCGRQASRVPGAHRDSGGLRDCALEALLGWQLDVAAADCLDLSREQQGGREGGKQ